MAENKTQKTTASVTDFLGTLAEPTQQKDARALDALLRKATGQKGAMWGNAIVGYGEMTYVGSGGRTVDWFPVGFSPRKAALTLYLMGGLRTFPALVARLGKHKVGGGCLYLPTLAGVDLSVLEDLAARTYALNARETARQSATKPAKPAKAAKKAVKGTSKAAKRPEKAAKRPEKATPMVAKRATKARRSPSA